MKIELNREEAYNVLTTLSVGINEGHLSTGILDDVIKHIQTCYNIKHIGGYNSTYEKYLDEYEEGI